MDELFSLNHVTAGWPGDPAVLRGLSWTVRDGEVWAIVGPVGSGKTTLAELLLGRLRPQSGEVQWQLMNRLRAAGRDIAWPGQILDHLAFREESRLFSYARHYYQQRFNFVEPLDDVTLDQFLRSGTDAGDAELRVATEAVGVESLRGLSLIKLSNGQTRRARIARALLARPELLILDDPFIGLDSAGRDEVADLLGEIVAGGQRLMLVTRPDMIPHWITHVLELEGEPPLIRMTQSSPKRTPPPPTEPVIELRDVSVAYGDRHILDSISWTVNAGERWAVLGPNGSGKSTLLSLLCGDHPQAYSNDVRLFGRRRGTGETIWDIKRRVGLVSPELHLYFHEPLTVAQTVATGFFDALTLRPTTSEQDANVRDLLAELGLTALFHRPFARLSTGQQRQVLLARALVKRPELVIFDEPFQGFDLELARRMRDWLDETLSDRQTLLFVTHLADEIPASVTKKIVLGGPTPLIGDID